MNKRIMLEHAKEVNKTREILKNNLLKAEELFKRIENYSNSLQLLEARAIKVNDDYRTRKLEYLSSEISDAMAEIFPEKGSTAELSCDFKRKNTVFLKVTDQHGHTIRPKMGCGQLMQYLISFAAVSKIAQSLGCNSLFIDEAFGVASEEKLGPIGDLVKKKVDSGMQIILVSQNSSLYSDIPRHEIRLQYNNDDAKAELVGYNDFEDVEKQEE